MHRHRKPGNRQMRPTRPVDFLFGRLAVEVFIVGFRIVAGMVDNAVPMIRRRIERIKLQWNIAGIDNVVFGQYFRLPETPLKTVSLG